MHVTHCHLCSSQRQRQWFFIQFAFRVNYPSCDRHSTLARHSLSQLSIWSCQSPIPSPLASLGRQYSPSPSVCSTCDCNCNCNCAAIAAAATATAVQPLCSIPYHHVYVPPPFPPGRQPFTALRPPPAASQLALLTTTCLLSTPSNKALCLFYAMPVTVLSCPDSAQGKSTGSRTHHNPTRVIPSNHPSFFLATRVSAFSLRSSTSNTISTLI